MSSCKVCQVALNNWRNGSGYGSIRCVATAARNSVLFRKQTLQRHVIAQNQNQFSSLMHWASLPSDKVHIETKHGGSYPKMLLHRNLLHWVLWPATLMHMQRFDPYMDVKRDILMGIMVHYNLHKHYHFLLRCRMTLSCVGQHGI